MATSGQKQAFVWRPNDNSSSTLLKYQLEAEHWTRAFDSARSKYEPVDYAGAFNVIGLVLGLAFGLIYLLISLIIKFFVWALQSNNDNSNNVVIPYIVPPTPNIPYEGRIRQILKNRPSVFQPERHKLFKKAALMVIMKQEVSISSLMYELKTDFDTVSNLIDQLFESGIISGFIENKKRQVNLKDKESLELLFKLEKQYSTI